MHFFLLFLRVSFSSLRQIWIIYFCSNNVPSRCPHKRVEGGGVVYLIKYPFRAMETWLANCGLEQYAKISIDQGYDDPSVISKLKESEVETWASEVGMKPGHKAKLLAHWRQTITSSLSSGDCCVFFFSQS